MSLEVWDYIFLQTDRYPSQCGIPKATLDCLRAEFQYWYPVDVRMSGKDLVQNHLTYFIYCHTAMWPNDKSVFHHLHFALLLWSLSCWVFVMLLWFLPCCCGLCCVVVVFAMLLPCCCGLCHVVVVFVMLWFLSCCFGFAVMLWSLACCCGLWHVVVVFLGKASAQAPSQFVLVKQKQKGPVFIPGALYLSNRGKMTLSTWRMLCTCQTEAK